MSTNPKEAFGSAKAPLRHTPAALVIQAGEVYAGGAAKYGTLNWRTNPVEAMTYAEAIERHLLAWREGQDLAEDSGLHHLAHVAASCGIVLDALAYGTLIDNRIPGPAAELLRERDATTNDLSVLRDEAGAAPESSDVATVPEVRGPTVSVVPCSRCKRAPITTREALAGPKVGDVIDTPEFPTWCGSTITKVGATGVTALNSRGLVGLFYPGEYTVVGQ